jgi:Xaa-Pro aminopeptidase
MDTLQAQRAVIRTRIDAVRNALTRHQLAALIVPSSDPHLSEYLPGRWQGREWLSGFTGSVGTLVVTADFAGLWVDSRYWVQAEAQLAGTGIALMKVNVAASTAHIDWLADHMRAGARVAIDGAVVGLAVQRQLAAALASRGAQLVTDIDLLRRQREALQAALPALRDAARATEAALRAGNVTLPQAQAQRRALLDQRLALLDNARQIAEQTVALQLLTGRGVFAPAAQ